MDEIYLNDIKTEGFAQRAYLYYGIKADYFINIIDTTKSIDLAL